MSRLSTCLAVAACATVHGPAGAASAALPDTTSFRITPGTSFGALALGQSPDAAKQAWGAREEDCIIDGCLFTTTGKTPNDKDGRARFNFRDGQITFISIEAPERNPSSRKPTYTGLMMKFKTSKKMGLGSSLKSLRKAYPKLRKTSTTFYELKGSGKRKTQFEIYDGRVSDIYLTVY